MNLISTNIIKFVFQNKFMDLTVTYLIDEFYQVYDIENSSPAYRTSKDEYYVCRYCGENEKKKFKSRAHLLPEFTGNKDIFCYDECITCNQLFGEYETSLNAFGGIKNVFLPIKGKNGYQKYKDSSKNSTIQYKDKNTLLNQVTGKDSDEIYKIEEGRLKVKAKTQSFIPLYVYKAIAKFALSIMKKEELVKFKTTIDWLLDPDKLYDSTFPLFLIVNEDARPPIIKPICVLFKKKKEFLCPEYCFVFAYGFHRYQIFLQDNEEDKKMEITNQFYLPLNYHFVLKLDEEHIHFVPYNMNYLNKSAMMQQFSLGISDEPRK